MQFFSFSALLSMVLDLRRIQQHDLMYALHIVSLQIHNNRHAQIFIFFHIWDHIDPILFDSLESILTGIILIHKLHKSLISCPQAHVCLLLLQSVHFLAFHVNYIHLIL